MDVTQISNPVLRENIQFRVLDDLSSVAVDPDSGQAHALTPVATAILERCDGTLDVDGIVAEVVEIFDGDAAQVRADVEAFLEQLVELGLIER